MFCLVACCRPLELDVSFLRSPWPPCLTHQKEHPGKCTCEKKVKERRVEVVVDFKSGQWGSKCGVLDRVGSSSISSRGAAR